MKKEEMGFKSRFIYEREKTSLKIEFQKLDLRLSCFFYRLPVK